MLRAGLKWDGTDDQLNTPVWNRYKYLKRQWGLSVGYKEMVHKPGFKPLGVQEKGLLIGDQKNISLLCPFQPIVL